MSSTVTRRSVMMMFSYDDVWSHRARIVCKEKDIVIDIEEVDLDNKPEDLIDLNPYGSIPTLVDRDLVLYDSRVIVEYLDERFPHPPMMPVDPVSRARTRLALYRIENDWYSLIRDLEGKYAKKALNAKKVLEESIISSTEVFEVKPFFLSDEFTLVDATIAPIFWRLEKYGIDLGSKAKPVLEYMDRIFSREGFKESLTESEIEMR
jgi:RNA polymerase-associated protein